VTRSTPNIKQPQHRRANWLALCQINTDERHSRSSPSANCASLRGACPIAAAASHDAVSISSPPYDALQPPHAHKCSSTNNWLIVRPTDEDELISYTQLEMF